MNLYVDDIRPAPPSWTVARTVAEAKSHLMTGVVVNASLDHDMGACDACIAADPGRAVMMMCPHVEDGSALVRWMEETGHWPQHKPEVHSFNPVGKARMKAAIARHYEANA